MSAAYQLSRAMAAQKRKNGLILILIFLALGILAVGVYAFVLPGHSINGLREALTQKPDISTAEPRQQVRGSNNPSGVTEAVTTASLSGIPIQTSEGSPTSTDLEATKWAVELWKPTKIRESYYIYRVDGDKIVFEFQKPVLFVSQWSVSKADKLNGLEWCGNLLIKPESVRVYYVTSNSWRTDKTGHWSEWRDFNNSGHTFESSFPYVNVDLEKRNGEWRITSDQKIKGGNSTFKQVSETDIPK